MVFYRENGKDFMSSGDKGYFSRRGFIKAAACLSALAVCGGAALAGREENIHLRKLCRMAEDGYFGKIEKISFEHGELKILGAHGRGRADANSLTASAKDIALCKTDPSPCALFEKISKEFRV